MQLDLITAFEILKQAIRMRQIKEMFINQLVNCGVPANMSKWWTSSSFK